MQNPHSSTNSSSAELQREVATMLVECLNLEVTADQINLDDPLYGEGLGLDSIDILEIAVTASKKYGLQLRADNANDHHVFSSLRTLADYITNQRTC